MALELAHTIGNNFSSYFYFLIYVYCSWGFPGSSVGKESACSAGDLGSSPWLERSLGEGNGKPLQYLCLENPMDRGAWQATVQGITKSQTRLK